MVLISVAENENSYETMLFKEKHVAYHKCPHVYHVLMIFLLQEWRNKEKESGRDFKNNGFSSAHRSV